MGGGCTAGLAIDAPPAAPIVEALSDAMKPGAPSGSPARAAGVPSDDPAFRAVGLEYLESVLPEDVRRALWPLIGDDDAPRAHVVQRRPRARDDRVRDLSVHLLFGFALLFFAVSTTVVSSSPHTMRVGTAAARYRRSMALTVCPPGSITPRMVRTKAYRFSESVSEP